MSTKIKCATDDNNITIGGWLAGKLTYLWIGEGGMMNTRRQAEGFRLLWDWLGLPFSILSCLRVKNIDKAISLMNSVGLWRRKTPWKLCMWILKRRLAKGLDHA